MFNAKKEKDKIVDFIREYFDKYNLGGVVIGISGGKDSGVVAGLFTEALGPDRILGVTMPCHSRETDRNDAKLVADHFGFKMVNMDLTEVFDTFNAVLPVGSLIYTPEQQEDYKARKKKEQDEYLRSKRYGEKKPSYTFVMTTADFKNVSPANLTRLIYLSTYLSYHNSELRKGERHKITKNELPQILGISERTAQRFWREVCPQYISEDIDETLKLNPDVFSRGRAKRLSKFA